MWTIRYHLREHSDERRGERETREDKQACALVRGSSLSHRLEVLERIHITPQLLQVLLQLSVFP